MASVWDSLLARSVNHDHGGGFGTPHAVGYANADGTDTTGVRSDHVHALSLTTGSNLLTGDVTMTNADQYYDGPTVTLAAGTWLLMGGVTILNGAGGAGSATARLGDGTNHYASGEGRMLTSLPCVITLAAIVAPGSSTAYKISAAGTQAGCKIKAAAPDNGAGNTAAYLYAVRIA